MKRSASKKYRKNNHLSRLLSFIMVVTLLAGLGGAALAAELGSISITKEEYDSDGAQLTNTQIVTDITSGTSVTA